MKNNVFRVILILWSLSLLGCAGKGSRHVSAEQRLVYTADIIVYGGTAAAITAAFQATRIGKSDIIVSPDKHLGGLSSGGLGFTDTGKKETIGGLAREFYHRIYTHYQKEESWSWQKKKAYGNKGQGTLATDGTDRTMWIFEPHAAEAVFEDFVKEYKLPVYRDEWLNRETGVKQERGKINSIQTLGSKIFKGKMFIDATYEGDLMAAAAGQTIDKGVVVQDLDYAQLKARLI